jgi:hypothetical protein
MPSGTLLFGLARHLLSLTNQSIALAVDDFPASGQLAFDALFLSFQLAVVSKQLKTDG